MQNTNLGPFIKVRDFTVENGNRFIRYEGANCYIVCMTLYEKISYCNVWISTHGDCPKYTPEMYVREDNNYKPVGVEIQTTSYGALNPEEIRANIAALQMAVDTATVIKQVFLDPLRNGTFDFGDLIPQEKEEEKC